MCVPVRPSPSTRQVCQITQYHSEKRAGLGVCCAQLISWPQVSSRCPEKELMMYHIPRSRWVSYGLLQKLRQMHTARSFVCIHLHMTQGAFLLLDLHTLKIQDNTGALRAAKAPGVCTNRSSWPQHTAHVWLIEGAALYINFPIPGCSALKTVKGKQRDRETSQRLLGPLSPRSSATALHRAAQHTEFVKKGQSVLKQDLDWQSLDTTFKIGKKKVTMTAVSLPPSFCPVQLCSLIGSLWSQKDCNSNGSKTSICFGGWREKEGKLENACLLVRN